MRPWGRKHETLGRFILTAAGLGVLVFACQNVEEVTQQSAVTAAVTYRLTVTGSGTGNGVVTSSPAGINCSITAGVAATTGCSAMFNAGVNVTLTARPASGHVFGGWVNQCGRSTGTCTLNMYGARSAGAEFRKGPFNIAIVAGSSGTGSGNVKSQAGLSPAIDCTITNGAPPAALPSTLHTRW